MKKLLIVLAVSAFVLTGCKDLSGNIQVFQSFFLKNDSGQNSQIPVGGHGLVVKFKGKKKFDLEMRLPQGQKTFRFISGQNLKKINNGDRFSINSKESGQPVNLNGQYTTQNYQSDTRYETRSCTYYTSERQCGNVNIPPSCQKVTECDPNDASVCKTREVCTGGGSEYRCNDVSVPHSGYQDVSYYDTTSTETVNGQLIDNQNNILAHFTASDSSTNRNTINETSCR